MWFLLIVELSIQGRRFIVFGEKQDPMLRLLQKDKMLNFVQVKVLFPNKNADMLDLSEGLDLDQKRSVFLHGESLEYFVLCKLSHAYKLIEACSISELLDEVAKNKLHKYDTGGVDDGDGSSNSMLWCWAYGR